MSLFVDAKISQKILPKLHGNKKRMDPVLIDLAKFCETGTLPDEKTNYPILSAVRSESRIFFFAVFEV